MYAKHCDATDLQKALDVVNEKYEGNVIFRRLEPRGKRWLFTLKVIDSRAPGHRRGYPHFTKSGIGRRMPCACWHVHGDFFDALFDINEDAEIIVSGRDGKRCINKYGGNWKDSNIGSMMYPYYFSQACDCE